MKYLTNHRARGRAVLCSLVMVGLLAACQMPPRAQLALKDVDIRDTNFDIPENLLKDMKAQVQEMGSKRMEQIVFDKGHFRYERYFMGGYRKSNDDDLIGTARYMYDTVDVPSTFGAAKKIQMRLGLTRYFLVAFQDGVSCFVFMSDQGEHIPLQGGTGTEGRLTGTYCAAGTPSDVEKVALQTLDQVRVYH